MISLRRLCLSTLLLSLPASAVWADNFLVTYEAPGAFNTTAAFNYKGVESFDALATGAGQSFTSTFGTSAMPVVITGQYSGVDVASHDQYGGASGAGNYATTFSSGGYSLSLSAVQESDASARQINYFGYWLSALDNGNQVQFYRGDTLVFSFDPNAVVALLGTSCPGGLYCGNPTTRENGNQAYVFLNFYDQTGLGFDRVVFSEDPTIGGYESDNHTVGFYTQVTGTPVNNDVPEPGSLALVSLALLGLASASRRRSR